MNLECSFRQFGIFQGGKRLDPFVPASLDPSIEHSYHTPFHHNSSKFLTDFRLHFFPAPLQTRLAPLNTQKLTHSYKTLSGFVTDLLLLSIREETVVCKPVARSASCSFSTVVSIAQYARPERLSRDIDRFVVRLPRVVRTLSMGCVTNLPPVPTPSSL